MYANDVLIADCPSKAVMVITLGVRFQGCSMNKDKAKVVLAYRAVERLSSSSEEFWTMKELFALEGHNAMDDAIVKYAAQKTWQRDFIQRLIDEDVVKKVKRSNHVAYQKILANDAMDDAMEVALILAANCKDITAVT